MTFRSAAQDIYMERICLDANNDIQITWISNMDTCEDFIFYEIWGKENDLSTFKKIGEVHNYYATNFLCIKAGDISNQWKYFLKGYRICGTNTDSVLSDTMQIDKISPDNIQIDTVSVLTGKTIVGWKESKSGDTKGYIIYYVDKNNKNIVIDTVLGKTNTSYYDTGSRNPNESEVQYRVVAFDSCDNLSAISFGHKTLFIGYSQDSCNKEVNLAWTPYSYWNANDCIYKIVVKEDGGNEFVFDSTNGNSTFISLKGLKNKTNYCMYIRCYNTKLEYSTSSNVQCFITQFIENPGYIYLQNIDVVKDNLELNWLVENKSGIKSFQIYKGEDTLSLNPYSLIDFTGDLVYNYIDNQVNVDSIRYYYKVAIIDNCNSEGKQSNFGSNILLKKKKIENNYFLEWNTYFHWEKGIENQVLFSEDKEEQVWVPEQFLDAKVNLFSSGLKDKEIQGYEKCYYILAEENSSSYGTKAISKSNVVCVTGDMVAFFPTVFCPGSSIESNKIFIPVGKLINWDESKIQIFNRWGELVWETSELEKGWTGNLKNQKRAPQGVYYYRAVMYGKNGTGFRYFGTLNLIR